MYKPIARQFDTSICVQHRVVTTSTEGAPIISYVDADPAQDFCKWRGKGGTETAEDVIVDTAEVTMWYRPDVAALDRVLLNEDVTKPYEILNVENIEQRNMWLMLKVRRMVMQWLHVVQILPCTGYGRHSPIYGEPVQTNCDIEVRATADKAVGKFPPGTAIKPDDRVIFNGKTYVVEHSAEEFVPPTDHVEVSLRGI